MIFFFFHCSQKNMSITSLLFPIPDCSQSPEGQHISMSVTLPPLQAPSTRQNKGYKAEPSTSSAPVSWECDKPVSVHLGYNVRGCPSAQISENNSEVRKYCLRLAQPGFASPASGSDHRGVVTTGHKPLLPILRSYKRKLRKERLRNYVSSAQTQQQ